MSVGLLDFRVTYHFEISGKMVGNYGQTHVQCAGRVLTEDPAYNGKSYAAHPTGDALKTIMAAGGISYPGAVIVIDTISHQSAAIAPNA